MPVEEPRRGLESAGQDDGTDGGMRDEPSPHLVVRARDVLQRIGRYSSPPQLLGEQARRLARFRRRTKVVSKCRTMVDLSPRLLHHLQNPAAFAAYAKQLAATFG